MTPSASLKAVAMNFPASALISLPTDAQCSRQHIRHNENSNSAVNLNW
jgi:hypothetical protein